MSGRKTFEVADFSLQGGETLPSAKLVYRTLGTLAPARDNVVLIPSWYSGTDREAELCMAGPDRAINPSKHFVVLTNLLSGGVSSSPSNTPPPYEAAIYAEFSRNFWERGFLHLDANDLLSLLETWQNGDISVGSYSGDLALALGSIKARAIVMPCRYDSYFPPVDNEAEVARMPNAECRIIDSIWGHMTLWNPADRPVIDLALRELLES